MLVSSFDHQPRIIAPPLTCYRRPTQAYWQYPNIITEARCLDEGKVILAAGTINCWADMLCTLVPFPLIIKLRIPQRQRIGICALMSMGFLVTAAGALRTYYIFKGLISSYDETWNTYPLWIWAAIGVDLAVVGYLSS